MAMDTLQKSAEPVLVPKETILLMTFPKYDVLRTAEERQLRQRHAERAALLGNGYQCKVNVIFMTADQELKMVDTTLWESDSEYITLKSGALIPITAIIKIEF